MSWSEQELEIISRVYHDHAAIVTATADAAAGGDDVVFVKYSAVSQVLVSRSLKSF